jgi:outer membrane protein, multidrug efflux system
MRRILALAGLLLATSCEVGPDYTPPNVNSEDVPGAFGAIKDPAFVPGKTDLTKWWTVFEDPQLNSLIERAAEGNKDLKIAVSRVSEARARLGISNASRLPSVGIGGDVARANDMQTGFETRTRSSIGANVSWELDVFGRVSREIEAATATYEATEEDERDIQVSLFAEVARAYLSIRALQMQLAAAQRNIESQRKILGLTQARLSAGLASQLDVVQAEGVLAASEAAVPGLRINLAREINTMGVLLGKNPNALHQELSDPKSIPVPPVQVTVGVPGDLLRQRPDIRAAERRLAAQTARVGIATSDLYPQFGINANLGLQNTGGNLFDAASQVFALGPSMRWNVFDGGRIRGQIKVEDARVDQALLLYEQAVLSAIEEVETSMTTFTEQRVRVTAVERAAAAARQALKLSTGLYKDGLISFQEVLDSQRTLFTQESDVAGSRGQAAQALVFLYRALGGGWDPAKVKQPPVDKDSDAAPKTETSTSTAMPTKKKDLRVVDRYIDHASTGVVSLCGS